MFRFSEVPPEADQVGSVLVVADEPELRATVTATLRAAGHTMLEARSAAEGLRLLNGTPIDVVVVDLGLPDASGLEVLKAVRSSRAAVVLALTASDAVADMRQALRLGAVAYLRKPADRLTLEAQVSVALSRKRAESRSNGARLEAVSAEAELGSGGLAGSLDLLPFRLASQLTHAWDLRHIETGAHVRRMAESTRRLARALGRSEAEALDLGRVAMLHDIGKIAIPDAILTKPGRLTAEELSIMQRHSEIGGQLLSGFHHPFLDLAAKVARSHHERWDGTGYPDHLAREDCPWEGRLVGVVDVFDALGHVRCYKPAWSAQQLIEHFESEAGKLYDPEIALALVALLPELEAVKSEYPDPVGSDYASNTRLKSAGAQAERAQARPKA